MPLLLNKITHGNTQPEYQAATVIQKNVRRHYEQKKKSDAARVIQKHIGPYFKRKYEQRKLNLIAVEALCESSIKEKSCEILQNAGDRHSFFYNSRDQFFDILMLSRNNQNATQFLETLNLGDEPLSKEDIALKNAIIFFSTHQPSHKSPLDVLINMAIFSCYEQPYVDGTNRTAHGSFHALRTALVAQRILNLYEQYHPEKLEGMDLEDKKLLILAAAFHDAANQSEIFHDEAIQADLFIDVMKRLGFEEDKITKAANGIRFKEEAVAAGEVLKAADVETHLGYCIQAKIIQSADAMEMLRMIIPSNFIPQLMKIHQDFEPHLLDTIIDPHCGITSFERRPPAAYREHPLFKITKNSNPYLMMKSVYDKFLSTPQDALSYSTQESRYFVRQIPFSNLRRESKIVATNSQLEEPILRPCTYIGRYPVITTILFPFNPKRSLGLLIKSSTDPIHTFSRNAGTDRLSGTTDERESVLKQEIPFATLITEREDLTRKGYTVLPMNECLLDYNRKDVCAIVLSDYIEPNLLTYIQNSYPGLPILLNNQYGVLIPYQPPHQNTTVSTLNRIYQTITQLPQPTT